ncbi:jun dimerization protein 2 isoform X1 [Hydra vulgaris]|uniref:Jun dimerization protein 2 isoform X1 n=1 Tax=Hydra vulgaris TaxID=6087 RepID=A0ABM4C2F9_HYDVU
MVMACLLDTPIMEENIPIQEIDHFLAEMASLDDDPLWDIDGYSAGSWHTDSDEDLSDKKFEIYENSINEESVNLELSKEISSETSDMSDILSFYTADMPISHLLITKKKKKSSRVRQKNETQILPKRERNKLAARRCRKKQKDRIEVLEKEVESIEHDNHEVLKEILALQSQLEELQQLLISHSCVVKEKL